MHVQTLLWPVLEGSVHSVGGYYIFWGVWRIARSEVCSGTVLITNDHKG